MSTNPSTIEATLAKPSPSHEVLIAGNAADLIDAAMAALEALTHLDLDDFELHFSLIRRPQPALVAASREVA